MAYRPNEKVPTSGIYAEQTANGTHLTEVTCVKHEHFPPAKGSGYH